MEDSIVRETVVAAPPARVWEVLTRAEYVGRGFGAERAEIDLRPGGSLVMVWAEHVTALDRPAGKQEWHRERNVDGWRQVLEALAAGATEGCRSSSAPHGRGRVTSR